MSGEAGPSIADRIGARVGRAWGWVLADGIVGIIVGILALAVPGATVLTLAVVLGVGLIVQGIAQLAAAWSAQSGTPGRGWLFVFGILALVAGGICLVHLGVGLLTISIGVAIWFFAAGVNEFVLAATLREGRVWNIVVGVLSVVAGAVVVAQPGAGLSTVAFVVGLAFLVRGVAETVLSFRIRSLPHPSCGGPGASDDVGRPRGRSRKPGSVVRPENVACAPRPPPPGGLARSPSEAQPVSILAGWLATLLEAVIVVLAVIYVVTGDIDVLLTWECVVGVYLAGGLVLVTVQARSGSANGRRGVLGALSWVLPLTASLAGVASAVLALVAQPSATRGESGGVEVVLAASGGIVLSWLLLQVGMAQRYEAGNTDASGRAGLRFPETDEPVLLDFLYFSFGVGAAFATSDTQVLNRRFRLLVIVHSTAAFFYSAFVVAVAYQVLQNLLSR